jgi:hypothetical protein
MFMVHGGALWTVDTVATDAAADGDAYRYSNGQPDRQMSGSDPEDRA